MKSRGGYPRRYRELWKQNLRRLERELIFVVLEDLWSLFLKIWWTIWWVMSLDVWMLWRLWTAMKKEGNGVQEPLYKNWKRGIFYPAQILKRNPDRWIRAPPLDARSITPSKVLNDVSRVPKRKKQLWDDENDISTCVGLNVFMVLNVIIFISQNYTFSPRARGKN